MRHNTIRRTALAVLGAALACWAVLGAPAAGAATARTVVAFVNVNGEYDDPFTLTPSPNGFWFPTGGDGVALPSGALVRPFCSLSGSGTDSVAEGSGYIWGYCDPEGGLPKADCYGSYARVVDIMSLNATCYWMDGNGNTGDYPVALQLQIQPDAAGGGLLGTGVFGPG